MLSFDPTKCDKCGADRMPPMWFRFPTPMIGKFHCPNLDCRDVTLVYASGNPSVPANLFATEAEAKTALAAGEPA